MHPDKLFGVINLYEFFLIAGVMVALLMLRVLGDRTGFDRRLFNFSLATGVIAIIGGYGSAVLFQAFYNYADTGVFVINMSTGATFYGGLIGGAGIFLLVYFLAGRFLFRDNLHLKEFFSLAGMAAACITAAHSLGRVGCLMAGCCHGSVSESCGIYMEFAGAKVLPVQLYEAVFLAALCALFTVRALKRKSYNLPMYMVLYGVWRFFIEYLRGDVRGGTIVSFLSPSQLTAVFMVAGGALLWYIEGRFAAAGTGAKTGESGAETAGTGAKTGGASKTDEK